MKERGPISNAKAERVRQDLLWNMQRRETRKLNATLLQGWDGHSFHRPPTGTSAAIRRYLLVMEGLS